MEEKQKYNIENNKKIKKELIYTISILIILCIFVYSLVSIKQNRIDYSNKDNWAYFNEGINKPVDLFIICPTVDMGINGNYNMEMTDKETKANFLRCLKYGKRNI